MYKSESNPVRTINFSEARSNLKEVLDTVTSDHAITIVTRRNSEDAVIMSLSDYNSLQETLHLFGSQANAVRLYAAMAEADASLPAGARILGPKGFDPPRTGAPAVTARKAIKADLRRNVHFVPREAASAAGRVPSEKSARKTAAKVPVKTKAAAKPRRKA